MYLFINIILGLLLAFAAVIVLVVIRIYTYKPELPTLTPMAQAVFDGTDEGADPNTKLFAAYRIMEDGGLSVKVSAPLFGGGSHKDGTAILAFAAMQGSTDIVSTLLDHGADVNSVDEFGQTALIFAAWSGDAESVRLLLSKHADIDTRDESGRTALAWARLMERHEVVETLMSVGAPE
jgi:hypothetical protein